MTMSDPVPVIPLQYANSPGAERYRGWRPVNRFALLSGAAAGVIAWLLVLYEVESVLATGPVMFAIGVLMVVGGFLRRQPWVWVIGAGHCCVCGVFIGLVNALSWDPTEARHPFILMGAAYNLLSAPAALFAWSRRAG